MQLIFSNDVNTLQKHFGPKKVVKLFPCVGFWLDLHVHSISGLDQAKMNILELSAVLVRKSFHPDESGREILVVYNGLNNSSQEQWGLGLDEGVVQQPI